MQALVIDDSAITRLMLAHILSGLGFDVQEAGSGLEALEKLTTTGPMDLALVDWYMPEMSGLDFVRAVRRDRSYDHMRLMMVTSATELGSVPTALEAGANEYLMKPFSEEMVVEKLQLLGLGGN